MCGPYRPLSEDEVRRWLMKTNTGAGSRRFALLDSAATHILLSTTELPSNMDAQAIEVHLDSGSAPAAAEEWREEAPSQPLIPMGRAVNRLSAQLTWRRQSCVMWAMSTMSRELRSVMYLNLRKIWHVRPERNSRYFEGHCGSICGKIHHN